MSSIDKALGKIAEINKILELDFENLQSFYAVADSFDLNVKTLVGNNPCKLIKASEDHLSFEVEILPGQENAFDMHWHDCLEVCTVIEGKMGDLVQTGKTAIAGEKISYKPMERHRPYNIGRNTLKITVDFYRTN